MKKIPYGISNFQTIIEDNYLYVDKTKYIEILEDFAPYQFFIRPRRFGKSLFISMLESYYDINKKDEFDNIFGNLYIGKNPTQYRNKFLVWKISFAGVDTGNGEEELRKSFNTKVLLSVKKFINEYSNLLDDKNIPKEVESAEMLVQYVSLLASKINKQIFVLIDEYDNFANELITGDRKSTYESILHGEGFVKSFYKAIKDCTNDNFKRIFITGVSPIMLDDLTSGFNITENLTIEENLNSVFGFTKKELEMIIEQIDVDKNEKDKLIKDMTFYYNGYKFNKNGEKIFNPDMTMYFLKNYLRYKRYPEEMIDFNVRTDYGRINRLAINFKDDSLITDIMNTGKTKTKLVEKFNISSMYDNTENFKSLLFYLGMLTIKGVEANNVILGIPNYVIKNIYWEEFYDRINKSIRLDNSKIADSISKMRIDGEITTFIEEFKNILNDLSNRDLMRFDEKYVKMILLTLFAVDNTYLINSELENNSGYSDIYLKTKIQFKEYTKYEWLIELKYIKESEKKKLESIKKEGLEQLKKYENSKMINESVRDSILKSILVIVVGKNEVYVY
ncbi:putative AAA-ATPase [Clostridium acetireducens DSM 10703]|uniref:Putative AAA-ATPase n=1 Tax=Clostridium acetireducens DSM 10703 TaxID=1121290 RepID=A0A1E8EZS4_9CLOT|nr:ATP-binding protein [Clostridium acetireducens]OFI06674.1 putative AAA-ATPase [Clostridium acetireducens DSM 10703]